MPFADAKERVIDAFESAYLKSLLAVTEGNVAEAARRAGMSRRHLYELFKKHGIRS
jgi:DNA-binding NtrC family response regulator